MQENNPVPTPVAPAVTPTVVAEQPKPNNFLTILLAVLLLMSISIAGFFAYQTQKLVNELTILKTEEIVTAVATTEPTTEPVATESFEIDPTANWKTYTNNVLKYVIKYPNDWILDKSEAELPINDQNSQKLVISKGEYKMTILWPSAYGPGICLFDDQSRVNASVMASYCEGKYVETKNISGTITHRRLESPDNYNQFEVYTLDGMNNFVTVPPIRFNVPSGYNNQNVLIMDQILSTYSSLN